MSPLRPITTGGGSPGHVRATGIRVHFGGIKAVDGVDLELRQGEIVGLIGPNGAGKTTLVNVLSGFQEPSQGRMWIDGTDVTDWNPQRLVRFGLARTFQSVRTFGELTLLENVELGALGVGASRKSARSHALTLLKKMDLVENAFEPAGALPHGDARRIGILRALATRPRFLLLDEPAAGLNETETDDLVGTVSKIRAELGCGVLVIEHDMRLIMGLSERLQVLDHGRTIAVGAPQAIRMDPAVIQAYLGSKKSDGPA